jgi:hypothetical protein
MTKRKIVVETDNSSWQAPKKRKKRKPMTEDQRQAAAKRLEGARAARAKKNSNYGQSGIHSSLRNLSEDHPIHPNKVKQWIKTQKELASAERAAVRQKVKGSGAKLIKHEGYVRAMQKYLRDGDWIDIFYGEHQEHKVRYRCTALAYYFDGPKKGEVKRDVGVYYPDMGYVYTQEMLEDDRETENVRREREAKR